MKTKLLCIVVITVCLCLSACSERNLSSENSSIEKMESSSDIFSSSQDTNLSNSEEESSSVIDNPNDQQENLPSSDSSNMVEANNSVVILEESAKILTQQIALSIFNLANLDESMTVPPDKFALDRFAISTVLFSENGNYLYKDFFTLDDQGYYHISTEHIQQEIYEVFGVADWGFTEQSGMLYDEQKKEYSIMSGFGVGNGLECQNLSVNTNTENNEIAVSYDLHTSSEFPNSKMICSCVTYFSICTNDNGEDYLRYIGTEL